MAGEPGSATGGELPPELLNMLGMTQEDVRALASAGGGSRDTKPRVYIGSQPGKRLPGREEKPLRMRGGDADEDVDEAFRRFYAMERHELEQFQRKAYRAGFYGSKKPRYGNYDEVSADIYGTLVDRAASFYASGKKLTFNDVLDMAVQSGPPESELAEEGPRNGTFRSSSSSAEIASPQSARVGFLQYLRQELGRAPNEQESRAFVRALQAAQQASPSVTSETATYVNGDEVSSSEVKRAGLDPDAFADEYVRGDEALATERNTFTVATDYYNIAMSVLGEGGL